MIFNKKHTWLECWELLKYDNSRGLTESTLKTYQNNLFKIIFPSFEYLKKQGYKNFDYIENFGFYEYKIWYRYMKRLKMTYGQKEFYSIHTLNRQYYILSILFDEAIKNGFIKYNIVKASHNFPTRNSIVQKDIKFQTLEEFKLFISIVDNPFWKVFFSILFWHGLRIGEMLALQIKDFDRETLKFSFYKTVSRHNLDDSKYKLTYTKNKKRNKIFVNPNCKDLFIQYFDKLCNQKNTNLDTFIFSYYLDKPLYNETVNRKLKQYYNKLKKQGYNVQILSTHEFGRHSIATFMKMNGSTVEQVAYYLRDSEDTIKKFYFHVYEKKLEYEINSFFEMFN